MLEIPDTVRELWLGSSIDNAAVIATQRARLWWSKSSEVDDEIRRRFECYVVEAVSRELDPWGANPKDRLALILLTDQFPRSIYRNSAKAFAFDSQALTLSREGIDGGFDLGLRALERVFFYLPLEHSELRADQERSVSLFHALVDEVGPDQKSTFQEYLDFAVRHREIIKSLRTLSA